MRERHCSAGRLVVIARDASEEIVTRITSNRDLLGAMQTGRSMLRLKSEAECIEVYLNTPLPCSSPLAAFGREDLSSDPMQ